MLDVSCQSLFLCCISQTDFEKNNMTIAHTNCEYTQLQGFHIDNMGFADMAKHKVKNSIKPEITFTKENIHQKISLRDFTDQHMKCTACTSRVQTTRCIEYGSAYRLIWQCTNNNCRQENYFDNCSDFDKRAFDHTQAKLKQILLNAPKKRTTIPIKTPKTEMKRKLDAMEEKVEMPPQKKLRASTKCAPICTTCKKQMTTGHHEL